MDLGQKPFYLTQEEIRWVEETRDSLSVRQKAGQLFCVMGGDFSLTELKRAVAELYIGGVLYRPAPLADIRSWYAELDAVAGIPLLKAANLEEGGSGAISDGTFFGWPMTVAATDDDEMMEKFALVCAGEGQLAGVNWTFSPVCDIDMNFRNPITNVRTCGSDMKRVQRLCSVYVKTLQEKGMAACAKHFPGDGVDFRDQHLHPSYNSLSAKEWFESYGAIYEQLIEDGLLSIMVGHIVQPNVAMALNPELKFEDCLPGSLCKELLTGVLREKFKFNGLITTDATIMGGFTQAMPRKRAIPAAIAAGCDMLVFNTDFYEDYQYMLDGINSGIISEERLDEAVTRILALKAKVARKMPSEKEQLRKSAMWQAECADKCVTLVKNTGSALPVTPERFPLIRLVTLGNDNTVDGSMTAIAEELLKREGFETERFDIAQEEMHGTGSLSRKRLTLYLANCEHASNQTTIRLNWAKKHALDAPRYVWDEDSVFVSFSNPYHLQDVPRVKTYINAYSCHRPMIEAVIAKLTGKSDFKGVSPVDAFCGLPDAHL